MTWRFTLLIFFIGLFSQIVLAQDGETIYKARKAEQKIENFLVTEIAKDGFDIDIFAVEIRDYLNAYGEKVDCMDTIIVYGLIYDVTLDKEKKYFWGDDDPTLLHDVVFTTSFVLYYGEANWGEITASMKVLKVLKSYKNPDGKTRAIDDWHLDNKKQKIDKW